MLLKLTVYFKIHRKKIKEAKHTFLQLLSKSGSENLRFLTRTNPKEVAMSTYKKLYDYFKAQSTGL